MTDHGQVDFAAFVSASPTSIVWTTSDGNQVVAVSYAGDIEAPGGVPTAGTINAIGVIGHFNFSASSLAVDLTDVTGAADAESFWRVLLSGETIVQSFSTGDFGTVELVSS